MRVLTPTLLIVLFYSFFVSWIFKFKSLLITFLLHSSSFFILAPSVVELSIYYDPLTGHINTQINLHPPLGFETGSLGAC